MWWLKEYGKTDTSWIIINWTMNWPWSITNLLCVIIVWAPLYLSSFLGIVLLRFQCMYQCDWTATWHHGITLEVNLYIALSENGQWDWPQFWAMTNKALFPPLSPISLGLEGKSINSSHYVHTQKCQNNHQNSNAVALITADVETYFIDRYVYP